MLERIRHMLIKEFIQIFRDPRMRVVIFLTPVIQLLVFGYAATTDVRHIATAVYDLDGSQSSRELVARLVGSGHFDVEEYIYDESRIRKLLDIGRIKALFRLNKGFEKNIMAGRTAQVQILLDGTDSNTAGIILNYSTRTIQQYSHEILTSRLNSLSGGSAYGADPVNQIKVQSRAWFNENLESRYFYVPGVIAILVSLITLMLTSMAVVREKEIGTMEQIMVTPITPVEFILGKTIPFALISIFDVVLVTFIGVFWFRVPIRGSLWLLLLATTLYIMTTLGIGLFISTVSRTQQQAMMSTFFFFFPAVLLSGFIFPIANMPVIVQYITLLNPMRYFLVIIRGIFLKGVGFRVLWPQMAALIVLGVTTLRLSAARFHKTMA
ncbi:MAG: ABC transporter permease [bacterium]